MKENKLTMPDDGTIYSPTKKHLFPKEVQHFIEVVSKQMPTNKSYLLAQKDSVITSTKEIFQKTPNQPLRKVIIEVLSKMPDFLTGENLVKVVTYITDTWATCEAKKTPKISPKKVKKTKKAS